MWALLEEYSAHDWWAATSVQRAPVTWPEWGLWSRQHDHLSLGRSTTPDVEGLLDLADLPDLVIPDVDKTALSTTGTRCLSRPGAHIPHVMNWWMGGGTYHSINKPYDITAALLESTCATASRYIYLNWSAPHMSNHTSWKIRSSILS